MRPRTETYWQARMTRPDSPAVPVYVSGMGRTFWVRPRYRALALATFDGRKFNLRSMARALGYSVAGLQGAIRQMADWGMLRAVTKRGRFGWTRLVWAGDVENRQGPPRANVRSASTLRTPPRDEAPEAVERTFGMGDARAACRAIAERLGSRA